MNSAFNDQILADKLKKLNNTQQSIETLSHWCIFHRKKAQKVVETWEKQLRELPKEQCVPFLYLANDILQNSRRRGLEFVREFWKVLPGALKGVIEKDDSRAHSVVHRLVDIWDERKVFGSRTRSLREELLGNDPPADLLEHRVKSSHTIKIKVPAGGIQEKLTSAYRAVNDVVSDEDATLGRCNAAIIHVDGLEKEANTVRSSGELQDTTTLADELQEQQQVLIQCIEHLEMCELARAALVSSLREALREQESKLELIRTQRQTAKARAEHSASLRQKLLSSSITAGEVDHTLPDSKEPNGIADSDPRGKYQWPPLPTTEAKASMIDEPKKPTAASVAAEVAAKLAASSSSAQVLTSVLSSIVAEEASSMKSKSAPLDVSSSSLSGDKRPRLHGQVDVIQSTEGRSVSYAHQSTAPLLPVPTTNTQHQYAGPLQLPTSMSQHVQQQYPPPPPLPPLPPYTGNSPSTLQLQSFSYARTIPPFATVPMMQGQMLVGTPQMVLNSHSSNPGVFPAPAPLLHPPGVGVYTQPPLPAPQHPRQ